MFASRKSKSERRGFRPAVENLEDRWVPATITPLPKLTYVVKESAPSAILIGLLKPPAGVSQRPAVPLSAIQTPGLVFVGPQPEPPTKPAPLSSATDSAILIGLL